MPELNLTGEQVAIKDNIMKVVNIESVISNLEEHIRNNQSSRLLFRQRRNNNLNTEAFATKE
jgi:hypothetical protein